MQQKKSATVVDRILTFVGLARSILMYNWKPFSGKRLQRFYKAFVDEGMLCFDLGAHVGNRTAAMARLGATVIAVEPQPVFAAYLRWRFRKTAGVKVLEFAIGKQPGSLLMSINRANPTLSTFSGESWKDQISRDARYTLSWRKQVQVEVRTLDELIESYGVPGFCKIDVENFEREVLQGLSVALPCMAFEYYPPMISGALECIDILERLGSYEYNWSLGETLHLESGQWIGADAMREVLLGYSDRSDYGDVYARLVSESSGGMRSI